MALQPGPPSANASDPVPMRCCETKRWVLHCPTFDGLMECNIVLTKRAPADEPCAGRTAEGVTERHQSSRTSVAGSLGDEYQGPMRVVNVLGVGPDGEGEELGTTESLVEAERIGRPAGWYRVHWAGEIDDYNDINLSYSWNVERHLWVSDDGGAYGEPLTIPVSEDSGDRTQGVTHYTHKIAELTDPPSRCARCDVPLKPGADSWYALDCKRAFDLCHECARPPIWWDPDGGRPRTSTHQPSRLQKILHKVRRLRTEKTFGYTDNGFWISPKDPFFGAPHAIQETVSLADSPLRCARCDAILESGTKAMRTYDGEREIGVACQDCGGRSPDLSYLL